MSLDITDRWASAPYGKIPPPSPGDVPLGTHAMAFVGYSDFEGRFKFANSWGPHWGNGGYGSISYDLFEATWWEGWRMDFTGFGTAARIKRSESKISQRVWSASEPGGGILHCRELVNEAGLPVAWAFGIERQGVLHIEELFVKPQFRRLGYGSRLMRAVSKLAADRNCEMKIWVSYADVGTQNLRVIDRLAHRIGLGLIPSGLRWAPVAAVGGFNTSPSVYELPHYDPPAAVAPETWKSVTDLLLGGASGGILTLLYQIVRSRVDAKNGRRIRVKDGDFELETTQLSEEEFLKLLGTLRDANDSRQIKAKLLDAGFSDRT